MEPKPKVNRQLCTNCMTCVDVCPMDVFANDGGKMKIDKPEECIGCRACEAQCPNAAIMLVDESEE